MLSFFPRDVLDEIWDLIKLVSDVFQPTLTDLSLKILGRSIKSIPLFIIRNLDKMSFYG